MSTQFSTGPTRNVQAGDTPDLNDGQLSRGIAAAQSITRGIATFVKAGFVTIAASGADAIAGYAAFVPTASVDNSGGADGDENVSGVSANQRVALDVLIGSADLLPDDYVKISATDGLVDKWTTGLDQRMKYARYLGKEAALLDRNTASPYDETLTPGIVPDQTLTPVSGDNVGWFQLLESQGGAEV